MPGSAAIDDIAPSNCRPPWLVTMIASAPVSAARSASSGSRMPFRISLPPQRSWNRFTSSQLSFGSNCVAVHEDSELMSATPSTCPWMLPNERRLVCSMFQHQRGLVARLIRLRSVGFGGVLSPLRMSLCRCPST